MRIVERKSSSGRERFDFACELKFVQDEERPGFVEGYGAVFNSLDRVGDIIVPGAFKSSIADWKKAGSMPPMLWQHDPDNPIGVWTDLREDEKGLHATGELILDVPQAKIARALLGRGAIRHLSIGYKTIDKAIDRTTGARLLKQIELFEVSLVTVPAMPGALVENVKDFDPGEMEGDLRDAGLSRRHSKIAVSIFRKALQRDAEGPEPGLRDEAADVLMSLRKATEALRA